ncbi:protease modulator HflC [Planctomyces sp. SH-PL62]|uniref:protease modulator HflC n=1 Tax=Planctomyces sp. SH-PL62 TaxID=1636152 RepID=UPI00078C65E9|nr:protease modulator HflC [Planctomyces sp. SH-PL62]AMV39030.1 Modulator of FtsH protease HflC [Planctomyces sp. SH-PL62]
MTPSKRLAVILGIALVLSIPAARSVCYVVTERELAVLLQFGEPVASRTRPGLYFKIPFIQEVLRLPKTLQIWHGDRQAKLVDVPTADGKKIEVTVWAVWRITDPVLFVRTLRTLENGESRVQAFVRSTARDTITTHNLAEIIRSTDRKMTYTLGLPPEVVAAASSVDPKDPAKHDVEDIPGFLVAPEAKEAVVLGRLKIMDQIRDSARAALAADGRSEGESQGRGIELVDVGISRVEFVPQVREAAFDRAIALMEAIAAKAIAEGEQRKKEIINKTEAEVQKIEGEGKQEASVTRGKVDAEVIDDYAKAIRESGDFYNFSRTLEAYKTAFKGDTRLILTTDGELLKMIKALEPANAPKPDGSSVTAAEAPAKP